MAHHEHASRMPSAKLLELTELLSRAQLASTERGRLEGMVNYHTQAIEHLQYSVPYKRKLEDQRREDIRWHADKRFEIERILSDLEEQNTLKSTYRWWLDRRPDEFSELQHLENPEINTATESEKALACAVAALVQRQRRSPR